MELGGPLSPEALGSLPTLPKVKASTVKHLVYNASKLTHTKYILLSKVYVPRYKKKLQLDDHTHF